MFRSFFPDEYLDSAYVIDYEKLYREGYRGLLFDIDNTIVPHGAPADERARKLFEKLRGIGFRYCFVSNNQKPRVEPFAKAVEGNFIENAVLLPRAAQILSFPAARLRRLQRIPFIDQYIFIGKGGAVYKFFTDPFCDAICLQIRRI